jgi:hypothetical protein
MVSRPGVANRGKIRGSKHCGKKKMLLEPAAIASLPGIYSKLQANELAMLKRRVFHKPFRQYAEMLEKALGADVSPLRRISDGKSVVFLLGQWHNPQGLVIAIVSQQAIILISQQFGGFLVENNPSVRLNRHQGIMLLHSTRSVRFKQGKRKFHPIHSL